MKGDSDIEAVLKKFDFFGSPVPSFNIDGHSKVRTAVGGCLSLITIFITFSFGLIKLQ